MQVIVLDYLVLLPRVSAGSLPLFQQKTLLRCLTDPRIGAHLEEPLAHKFQAMCEPIHVKPRKTPEDAVV
jgi:hypothetical protein